MRFEKFAQVPPRERKQHVIHKRDRRRRPFDVEDDGVDRASGRRERSRAHGWRPAGKYAGPKQTGWKSRVDAALRVVRRPARLILEQTNRRGCDGRRRDRTSGACPSARESDRPLHFDREHRAAGRMDVEQPAPFDDETDFVLVVPVLAAEFVQHGVEIRRVGLDVDHVGRDVAAARFELVDLRRRTPRESRPPSSSPARRGAAPTARSRCRAPTGTRECHHRL